MKMWKIYVAISDYSSKAIEILKTLPAEITVRELGDRASEDELYNLVKEYDIIIIGAREKMTEKVYSNVRNLNILGTLSIGVDHIDEKFFEDDKIEVINCPYSNIASVAEHTYALILALLKKIIKAHSSSISLQERKGMTGLPVDMYGKTLGVVGAGRIGTKVMQMASAFGMMVLCHTYHPEKHRDLEDLGVKFENIEELFMGSDIITIHLPLTDESNDLISKDLIKLMKKTSIIINTSRTGIVDMTALKEALDNKSIFGAGIDLDQGDLETPKKLGGLPNVILTPHSAGVTKDSIVRMDTDLAGYIVDKVKKSGK